MSRNDDEIRLRITSDFTLHVTKSGIYLRTHAGPSISVEASGITLDSGNGARITLQGETVDVNRGALRVT